uniref:Uncharacterized protein n=1 Tax=Peronospora matthiolae TaxID=2874970 RepID=A0AAV1TYG6_9STRA
MCLRDATRLLAVPAGWVTVCRSATARARCFTTTTRYEQVSSPDFKDVNAPVPPMQQAPMQELPLRVPYAHQRKLAIHKFNGTELY